MAGAANESTTNTPDRALASARALRLWGLYLPETHYEVFELPYPQRNGFPVCVMHRHALLNPAAESAREDPDFS